MANKVSRRDTRIVEESTAEQNEKERERVMEGEFAVPNHQLCVSDVTSNRAQTLKIT